MNSTAGSARLTISPAQLSIERAGESFAIHPLWLRERCQDAGSIDVTTGQRLHDPSALDPDLHLLAVSECGPGRLRIRFSDGHEAEFSAAVLLAEAALPAGDHDCPAPVLWNSDLKDLPRARWRAAAGADERAEWVAAFLRFGFIIFSGCQPRRTRC